MTLFRYQATNEHGEQVTGTVDATDEASARSALADVRMSAIALTAETPAPAASSAPPPSIPAPEKQEIKQAVASVSDAPFSLLSTLRLYAGWLLAWYGLVMALGYYSDVRTLPFEIPFVHGLFLSSLVFSFLLATFLFLLMSSLARALRGGLITGGILGICAVGLFYLVKTHL